MKYQKNCFICGNPFQTNRSYQKNCSPECCERMRHQNCNFAREVKREAERAKKRTCPECGKKFNVKKNLAQKYCSLFCRNKWSARSYETKYPGIHAYSVRNGYYRLKTQVFNKFGGKCNRCGIADWRVLQINHVNGGGTKDIRTKRTRGIYKEILEGSREGDFNLLCANCNILYEYERGIRGKGLV